MSSAKRLTVISLLTAASLATGLVESRFPLPVPGMRLGVANVFILTALMISGPADAAAVAASRVALSFLLSGNAAAALCGAGGHICSLPVMAALRHAFPEDLSAPAISAAGAFAFNFGQTAVIAITLKTPGVFGYLPVLLAAAAATGFAIGRAAEIVCARLKEANLL